MNLTLKKFLTNTRIIILILFLIFAVFSINPQFGVEGVAVRSVLQNSSASVAGLESPSARATPTSREVIFSINNLPIKSVEDYDAFVSSLSPNQTFTMESDKGFYRLTARPLTETRNVTNPLTNETIMVEKIVYETVTHLVNVTENNGTVEKEINQTINKTVIVPLTEEIVLGVEPLGLKVYDAPTSNLRKGLDLSGGTRVLLQPEKEISDEDMSILMDNMKERLNVFGLSDLIIRQANDLSGNQYILLEIAGANEEEAGELVRKQGKFEAKIGNETVFRGGQDITYVCRSADCSGIDPNVGCGQQVGGYSCRFVFSISLTPESAQKQADVTGKLTVETGEAGNRYLSEPLTLFLDDAEVDQLQISEDLRGRAVTEISISGSGSGPTEQEALFNTLENMKRLQTILITGSLPVKLNIVQTNNLSPALGKEFLENAIWVGIFAILAVALIVLIRYRTLKVALPVVINMVSEIILLLGFASLVGWNLDLVAVAGILVAVGTGVDDQIVIADETLSQERELTTNWKNRLKNAFFIIFAAYATTMFAMAPLLMAGAGLLKGFALTTMAGITFGVLITRPAFAAMLQILLKE